MVFKSIDNNLAIDRRPTGNNLFLFPCHGTRSNIEIKENKLRFSCCRGLLQLWISGSRGIPFFTLFFYFNLDFSALEPIFPFSQVSCEMLLHRYGQRLLRTTCSLIRRGFPRPRTLASSCKTLNTEAEGFLCETVTPSPGLEGSQNCCISHALSGLIYIKN